MIKNYKTFIQQKSQLDKMDGFKPIDIPDFLFPFQQHLVKDK